MAMVIAQRGQNTIKVSKHAYETMFRDKGYRLIGEQKTMREPEEVNTIAEGFVEEPEEKEVDKIPVAEMNKEQLAEYAKEHNIDTSAARNVREARQIIQKAMRESKM